MPLGTVAIAFAALFGIAIWFFYLPNLSIGSLVHYDEYYTLDRSTGFAKNNDWFTVYSEGAPTFKKPPLQYWMSAGLLAIGVGEIVALRLTSYFFALLTLAAVAALAHAIAPRSKLAVAGAVVLLSCSGSFWQFALSAMLDTGATFFVTAALASAIIALNNPKFWLPTAVFVGLGTLQKAPVGLILLNVFIASLHYGRHWTGFDISALRQNLLCRRAIRIALIISISWLVLQAFRHGFHVVDKTIGGQMLGRFTPLTSERSIREYGAMIRLILGNEPMLRGLGILAIFALPFATRRRELLPLPVIMVLFIVAMFLASGKVYGRYSLLFEPLQAAALAVVATSLVPKTPFKVLALVAVVFAAGGPITSSDEIELHASEATRNGILATKEVGKALQEDELFVACMFDRATRPFPGFLSAYVSPTRPFVRNGVPDKLIAGIRKREHTGSLRGLCTPDDLRIIEAQLVDLEQVSNKFGFVHWTATGLVQKN